MAELERMIAQLRGEGTATAAGGFTLDAEKAREKLRQFQLADPHRYVLLLIQALAQRGATQVAAQIDTSSVTLASDADPFTAEELQELYALLFADVAPRPGLRELALSLNAAMALNPRNLVLEAGGKDGEPGVRLEQRNDRPDAITRDAAIAPGVRVTVRERFRPGLILRFFSLGSEVVREQLLLSTRCGLADIAITINGDAVPRWTFPPGVAWAQAVVLDGRTVGRLCLEPGGNSGRVEIVRHHVWLTTHVHASDELAGVHAWVDASHLRTDASMADVVQDEAYALLLQAVGAARDRALGEMARALAGSAEPLPAPLRRLLCLRVGAHLRAGGARDVDPAAACLALPLWPCLDGTHRASAAIADTTGKAPFARAEGLADLLGGSAAPQSVLARYGAVPLLDATALEHFRMLFGDATGERTALVRRGVTAERNRAAALSRPHPPQLPQGDYGVRVAITGEAITGELGWCLGLHGGNSWIRILHEGCMLVQIPVDLPGLAIHAVIAANFRPTDLFDEVARDAVFETAMHAMLVAFADAGRQMAQQWLAHGEEAVELEALFECVRTMNCVPLLRKLLRGLGISDVRANVLLAHRGTPWALRPEIDLRPDSEHPLTALPMFEDGAGAPLDLRAIVASAREHGTIRVIAKGRPKLSSTPVPVVRAGERRLELLEALFGGRALQRVGREFEQWLARDRLLGTAAAKTRIDAVCALGPFTFEAEGIRGEIGVLQARTGLARADVSVQVLGRELVRERPPCGIGDVVAVFDLGESHVAPSWDRVTPQGRVAVYRALAQGVELLCERMAAAGAELTPALAPVVLDALAAAFPHPEYLQAWIAMGRDVDERARRFRYRELLRLHDEFLPGQVDTALTRALAASVLPLADALAIEGKRSRASEPRSLQAIACAEHAAALLTLPVIPATDGTMLALDGAVAAIAADGTWPYVVDEPLAGDTGRIAMLSSAALGSLRGWLGSRLRNAGPELVRAARRREFEARPQLEELEPPEPTLVTVEVETEGLRGVVGVPRRVPGSGPGSVLACTRRRVVATADPVAGTPWVGAIDSDDLGLERDFQTLDIEDLRRLRVACDDSRATAAHRLVQDWSPEDPDAALRRVWAQHLLASVVVRGRLDDGALASARLTAVAAAPLFADADGHPRSLVELRARVPERGGLPVVRTAGLRTDDWLVHARDDVEAAVLAALFEQIEDAEPVARKREALEQAMRSAPPLPPPPADAVATLAIDSRELVGTLWISPRTDDGAAIVLGRNGHSLSSWHGSTLFPVEGALEGDGVGIANDYSGCELTRTRAEYVKTRAALLYGQLVGELEQRPLVADDPRSSPLRALLLRLGAISLAKQQWPGHNARRLFRDLRDLPLLPLGNGRAISWTTALRTRPPELAALGLWNPAEAPVRDEGDEPEPTAPGDVSPIDEPPAPQAGPRTEATPTEPAPPQREDASAAAVSTTSEHTTAAPSPMVRTDPRRELLARIADELRILRDRDQPALADVHLERIAIDAIDGRLVARWRDESVVLDARHALVARALAGISRPDDPAGEPLLVSLVASAALTVLNLALQEVTDEQECRWLASYAAHLCTAHARDADPA
ncbi:MAG: hypothetical protein K1X88_17925 [Nannocystaceae bacterium]|nr:hypothetical protein [Nannocystaceae bacterium]